MTQKWRAAVTWPLPDGIDVDRLEALTHALPGFGIVVTDESARTLRAEMTVEAGTLRQAADAALRAARAAYATAFRVAGEPAALRALPAEAAEREAARPAKLDLIGTKEAAQILGVKPQRVGQLRNEHPDFPAPVAEPSMGPIFTRESIEAFGKRWVRRSGRPRKSS